MGARLQYDFIVIGAGMAGASAGYFLADHGRLLVLEMESQPGYHTTGRSAALYSQAYGNATIRALTVGGWDFLGNPPDGFTDHPLVTPRGAMFVGRPDQVDALTEMESNARQLVDSVRAIDAAEACRRVSVLRRDALAGAVVEPDAMDIDVHALHQGFLRGLKTKGGVVATDRPAMRLDRSGGHWRVETGAGAYQAPVLVDAAGAWGDAVAEMAGVVARGLVPKRRTAILFDPPAGVPIESWPLVVDVDETFYFKPDAGRLLGSPADETPSPPCDAQPEELDIARTVDRIQSWTSLEVRRIESRWAGLRSFVADKSPVVGFDPEAEGFFWLIGQGGYGIQTAPSMGRLAAALATGGEVPKSLGALGLAAGDLAPDRPALSQRNDRA